MAIAVPNVTTAAVPVQTATTATRPTTDPSNSDPFQTILTQATTNARAATGARDVNAAADAQAADQLDRQRADAADAATDATAAQLAAQLASAQLAAAQLAAQNPALPTAGLTALPTNQLATDAARLTAPEAKANPLVAAAQPNALLPQTATAAGQPAAGLPQSVTQNAIPTQTTPTSPPPPPAAPVQNTAQQTPVPAVPDAATQNTNTTGLAAAIAAIQPGQQQVVTAQAPIVAGLLPTTPDAVTTTLPTPVTAPQAPVEAVALPNVTVGNRPGTAGEQFAAIASAASTLTPAATPLTTQFAQTLSDVTLTTAVASTDAASTASVSAALARTGVPNQLAASDDRKTARDAVDGTQTAALPPTFSPAPAAQSVSQAQTTTAVKTPDPVAQVADGIVTHAHMVNHAGQTEFQMRLDPPELGSVKVRLVADGDGIRGQVVVSNDAIRRMIESQLPELRQRLEQSGVTVGQLDVATDANRGSGAGTGSDAGGGWGGYRSEFPAADARTAPATALRAVRSGSAGAVDVMA